MPKNSFYTKELATGCKLCQKGAKLVLLVTGLCNAGCFYCPLSEKKKGKDVIYADEKLVKSNEDILEEAELIEAEGTGITGGDPLVTIEKTIEMIHLLKDYFGEKHHIHLYTATLSSEKVKRLEEAGLDEIRFHPPSIYWEKIEKTNLKEIAKNCEISANSSFESLNPGINRVVTSSQTPSCFIVSSVLKTGPNFPPHCSL